MPAKVMMEATHWTMSSPRMFRGVHAELIANGGTEKILLQRKKGLGPRGRLVSKIVACDL